MLKRMENLRGPEHKNTQLISQDAPKKDSNDSILQEIIGPKIRGLRDDCLATAVQLRSTADTLGEVATVSINS